MFFRVFSCFFGFPGMPEPTYAQKVCFLCIFHFISSAPEMFIFGENGSGKNTFFSCFFSFFGCVLFLREKNGKSRKKGEKRVKKVEKRGKLVKNRCFLGSCFEKRVFWVSSILHLSAYYMKPHLFFAH